MASVFSQFGTVLRGYLDLLLSLDFGDGMTLGAWLIAVLVVGGVLHILFRSIRAPHMSGTGLIGQAFSRRGQEDSDV